MNTEMLNKSEDMRKTVNELTDAELELVNGGTTGEAAVGVGSYLLGMFGGPVALAALVTAEAGMIAYYGSSGSSKKV